MIVEDDCCCCCCQSRQLVIKSTFDPANRAVPNVCVIYLLSVIVSRVILFILFNLFFPLSSLSTPSPHAHCHRHLLMSIPQLIPIAQGEHPKLHTPALSSPSPPGVHADILLAPGASHPDDRPPTDIVDATSRLIVLKLVVAQKNGVSQARRPHDVVREVRTLEKGRHDNVSQQDRPPPSSQLFL